MTGPVVPNHIDAEQRSAELVDEAEAVS